MACKNCVEKDKEIESLKKRIMQLRPEKTHFDMGVVRVREEHTANR